MSNIENQLEKSIKQKVENDLQGVFERVAQSLIYDVVQEKVNATVTALLNQMVASNAIVDQINSVTSAQAYQLLDRAVKSRVASSVSQVDLGTEISNQIAQFVEDRVSRAALPANLIPAASINWNDFVLPASKIGSGIINDFTSQGIEDFANEVNLTVVDGQVIVERELIANDLKIVNHTDLKDLAVSGRLSVNGTLVINDPKFTAGVQSIVDDRIVQYHKENPLDLNGAALTSNQVKLIDTKSLGPSIAESNLRKLGRLISIDVAGESVFAETLHVNNGKVGINTEEPAGVLTLWDEESELSIRKYKNRNMYVGSSRDSELTLGVGGAGVLAIHRSGVNTPTIKIGTVTVSTGNSEPTHRGSPGDLVINDRPDPRQPWAWRCIGGEQWKPLD